MMKYVSLLLLVFLMAGCDVDSVDSIDQDGSGESVVTDSEENNSDNASKKAMATGNMLTNKAQSTISEDVLASATNSKMVARADTPETIRGQEVFQYWCATCHAPGFFERGLLPGTSSLAIKYQGKLPAALEHREDLSREYVEYVIRHGSNGMPFFRKTEVSDSDMKAIAAYLAPNDVADAAGKGKERSASEIYTTICAACHGEKLQGGVGPSLVADTYLHGMSADEVSKSITSGYLEKGMPSFSGVLSEREIQSMVVYLAEQRSKKSLQ